MTESAVTTRHLSKRFGDVQAVRDVSLDVAKSEIFGFLGPNGSGKSTTIRMLLGLLRPSEGEIVVLGHRMPRDAEALRKRIGYMTQRFSLWEDLTCRENLEFVATLQGLARRKRRERIADLAEALELTPILKQRAGTLSGGQRQRLALAAAIVHEPELLFLDEPTSAVDPESRREFWERLFDLAGEGVTILVSTHFMDEAERCHELAILDAGELKAAGTPDELMASVPQHVVLVECDRPREAQHLLRESDTVKGVAQIGLRLRVMVDPGVSDPIGHVAARLEAAGIHCECAAARANLEDVFVAYT